MRQVMRLLHYGRRRAVRAVPLAAAVLVSAFALIHVAPGDPLLLLAGDGGTPAYYSEMRARYGLDQPLTQQFLRYAANVLTGDFGYSFSYQRPALAVVMERLPATLLLGCAALAFGVSGGLALGLLSVWRPGSWLDGAVRLWTATAYALPVFWLGQLLIFGFSLQLGLLPVAGMTSARAASGSAGVADVAWHLILPASTLALSLTSLTARVARAALLDTLARPWAVAVLARGVPRIGLLIRHALPNALIPVVMVTGNQAGALLSGAALTEAVFAWPGLGRLLIDASLTRDAPLALAVFLFGVATVVAGNLTADLVSMLLDPRIEDA